MRWSSNWQDDRTVGGWPLLILDPIAALEDRLSLAFFSSPNKDAVIETIGPTARHATQYPPIVAEELMRAQLEAAYRTKSDHGECGEEGDEGGQGAKGGGAPVNQRLRELGEKQVD